MTPDRRGFLGASEIAAVLGLNPHRSPYDVWVEKTADRPTESPPTEDTVRGHAMEPVIEAILEHRGIRLAPGGEWRMAGTPIVAHPDRLLVMRPGGYEMKAPRRWSKAWGEDGTDDAPMEYLVQVQVQMAVGRDCGVDIEDWNIAAMCGELRIYPIQFSQDTARRILDYCIGWWERHVVKGDAPPATTIEEINQIVARVPATQVDAALARQIVQLKTLRKIESRAKDLGDETKRAVLAALAKQHGDVLPESIADPDGNVIATIRRGGRPIVDTDGIRGVDPDLVDRFTRRIEWNELRPSRSVELIAMPEILALEDE